MNKKIKLGAYSESFGPRVVAMEILKDSLASLDREDVEKLIFDLTEVKKLSTGYSKELFGGLWKNLGNDFPNRILFKFGENKNILVSSILLGIEAEKTNL